MSPAGRVTILTKGAAINPASRYRFLQFLPHLQAAGLQVDVLPLLPERYYTLGGSLGRLQRIKQKAGIAAQSFIKRLGQLPAIRRADLVVIENQLFPYEPGLLELAAKGLNTRIVFEFDDAIYLTPLHRNKLLRSLSHAHHVIVGNAHLANFARQATQRVSVVPTVVDTARYPLIPPEPSAGRALRVGWIGIPAGMIYLKYLHAALARVARDVALEFYTISSRPYSIPGVRCRFVPWSEAEETRWLSKLDIGVMPMPDTEWARGKCGLKLLQYMAAGRAAIASPVGVNREIVTHGTDGLLAGNDAQWEQALRELAGNANRRIALGQAARARVESDYSLASWGPKVAELYKNLIESAPPGA